MTTHHGNEPTAYQEAFVVEMQARRDAVGLSRNKLAQALGCTPQWIAKVETFEKVPSEGLADDLDTFFECCRTFRHMWEKHVEVRKRGLIPKGFLPLAEAERETMKFNIFAPLLIPGLLQTEAHARLILEAEQKADKVNELVAVRLERQKIFDKADCPWVFLLLREVVLRELDPEVKKEQCGHLLDMLERQEISVQIIPARARVFQGSGFQLLSCANGSELAYVDGAGGYGQMFAEPADVRRFAVLFDLIRCTALPAKPSERLVRTIMEDE